MAKRVGRPPLTGWLPAAALPGLPEGIALHLDLGRHRPQMRARLLGTLAEEVHVADGGAGELVVEMGDVRRVRVVPGLFEPGDPVLRRGVPAAEWRGGVVRCRGREVFVELIDGSFAWLAEAELERADRRLVDVVEADSQVEVEG